MCIKTYTNKRIIHMRIERGSQFKFLDSVCFVRHISPWFTWCKTELGLYRFNSIKTDIYKWMGILNYKNISRLWKWKVLRLVWRWNCSPGILVSPLLQCLTRPLLLSLPMLTLPLHKDTGYNGLRHTTSFTLNYCLKGFALKNS